MLTVSLKATQPPFAQAMVDFLKECFLRSNRPAVVQALMPGAAAKYEQDMNTMREVAAQSTSFIPLP